MTHTTNYNLNKPSSSDFYNIGDFNDNADVIDTELKKAETHRGNTSNPHNVTKTQVGLGNVPNVSTNNQTPTFTESASLDNLVSGEKLSISFGKIVKAIAEFVSHKNNTANPHSVTKSQVGLGNVDNTSDVNKPISTATQTALNGKAASSHSHAISDVTNLQTTLNGKATTVTYTVSVGTGWTTSGSFKTKTVTVSGILSTDNPVVDVVLGSDADANELYMDAWGLVQRIVTATGSITLYAAGEPQTAFTVQLKVVK